MNQLLFLATDDGIYSAQSTDSALRRAEGAWETTGHSLASHQVNSLSILGSTILAGTTKGVFRSGNLGQTWRPSSEGLAETHVRWLAQHPDGSGRILAGTEPAAIYLSRDGGRTWSERPEVATLRDEYGWFLPYSAEAGCVRDFAFAYDGERVYAAVEVGGLLRSDDAGESWQLAPGSSGRTGSQAPGYVHPDVHSVNVHPWSRDLVFAATGGGMYSSENGGTTWAHLYDCYCRAAWPDPAEAANLVLGPADGVDRGGRIERTFDGGETWQRASEGLDLPWSRHMVERFLWMDQELLAVLSNGEVLAAPLLSLEWRPILPEIAHVRAAATIQGQ
jgi:photosystem II stability/assembly factor-like uncharacterized protein